MSDFKNAFQAAGGKSFDDQLAKFTQELPLIVGEVLDHFQHGQPHSNAQHSEKDLHIDLPAGVAFSALKGMGAYKELHEVCSAMDAQIVHEQQGATSRIFVNPLGEYKDSADAGLMNKASAKRNDTPKPDR